MVRILGIVALTLCSAYCFAQGPGKSTNPMKYALIDGAHSPRPNNFRSKSDLPEHEKRYHQYAHEIVQAYKSMFNLSGTQASIMLSGLINYYSVGTKKEEIHLYIGQRIKGLLPAAQYLQWKTLKSYPEYSFFYLNEWSYNH